MGILTKIFGGKSKSELKDLVANKQAIVVDVRSTGEYNMGHVKGSLNIPLEQISSKSEALKGKGKVIITVCASGNRSGMAKMQLKAKGIEVYNGGAWHSMR